MVSNNGDRLMQRREEVCRDTSCGSDHHFSKRKIVFYGNKYVEEAQNQKDATE